MEAPASLGLQALILRVGIAMTAAPTISAATVRNGDLFTHVELTLTNTSSSELGIGGLRFEALKSSGDVVPISAANYWPVPPGGSISFVAVIPMGKPWVRAVRLKGFEYVETSGRVIPLDSSLDIGMLGGVTMTS